MTNPLVTVILTVFKRIDYLQRAIGSVLDQTFSSFEVLVTDDANQPETREICNRFWEDGRVRYRANPQALGTPLNVATALRDANGKYVCILNDDDLLDREFLARLVEPLEIHPEVTVAFCNHRVIDAFGIEIAAQTRYHRKLRSRTKLSDGIICHPFGFALEARLDDRDGRRLPKR